MLAMCLKVKSLIEVGNKPSKLGNETKFDHGWLTMHQGLWLAVAKDTPHW